MCMCTIYVHKCKYCTSKEQFGIIWRRENNPWIFLAILSYIPHICYIIFLNIFGYTHIPHICCTRYRQRVCNVTLLSGVKDAYFLLHMLGVFLWYLLVFFLSLLVIKYWIQNSCLCKRNDKLEAYSAKKRDSPLNV